MARGRTPFVGEAPQPLGKTEDATPAPTGILRITLVELQPGAVLHRVHQDRYMANQFNPGMRGNARFSPIRDEQGRTVPTLYGGTTRGCALMETVFHDVPHTAGFKSYDKAKLAGQVHSTIQLAASLRLVSLASVPLRKLGVTRRQLIDTEKDQYPATRRWAEAIHRQCPQAQGLSWVSRQDDSARAVMLFGDRISGDTLQVQGLPHSLTEDANTYDAVLDLAEKIGVVVVLGNRHAGL